MIFNMKELSEEHPLIKAAVCMAEVYEKHETMCPAVTEASSECPEVSEEQLQVMWLAVNAKALAIKECPR